MLRAIKRVADAGRTSSKPVSVCGDMAYDPALLPVLIGMGISHFSIPPFAMARVRQCIAQLDAASAQVIADGVLASGRVNGIGDLLGFPRPQITN